MSDDLAAGRVSFDVLGDNGAEPVEVHTEAARRGVSKLEAIRLIRGLYPLSPAEARVILRERIAGTVEDPGQVEGEIRTLFAAVSS